MHLLFRRNRQLVSQALMEDHVYMGHRRFLPIKHPSRRRHAHYDGKADHRTKPRHRCGKIVFEMEARQDLQRMKQRAALHPEKGINDVIT